MISNIMKKINQIFPVVTLEAIIDDHISINSRLINEINTLFPDQEVKGVLSHKWHDHILETGKPQLGYTSFNSNNLIENKNFDFFYDHLKIIITEFLKQLDYTRNWEFVNSWASVYPKGAYIPLHDHKPFHWSGAYYVNAHENCGDIYFVDPKEYALQNEPTHTTVRGNFNHRVTPVSGMLLMFPSYLKHETLPNKTDEDRIIISFNVLCK